MGIFRAFLVLGDSWPAQSCTAASVLKQAWRGGLHRVCCGQDLVKDRSSGRAGSGRVAGTYVYLPSPTRPYAVHRFSSPVRSGATAMVRLVP
jgi:hypothetical protein